jgi:hypothetical protein
MWQPSAEPFEFGDLDSLERFPIERRDPPQRLTARVGGRLPGLLAGLSRVEFLEIHVEFL